MRRVREENGKDTEEENDLHKRAQNSHKADKDWIKQLRKQTEQVQRRKRTIDFIAVVMLSACTAVSIHFVTNGKENVEIRKAN